MHRIRHKSRRRNKQRKIIIVGVCSLLLIMTVGYAAMQTNLEINAKGNVVKKATAGSDLVDQAGVVTSGDGLYADSYESNVYTYRGSNPNNYVTFNGENWRIISVNTKDNTIKIMRNATFINRRFDTSSGRYQGGSGYCNGYINGIYFGCNIWGSSSTLFDSGGITNISTLARVINGTKYALPTVEADLNEYLNTTYYNSTLNATARSMVKEDAVYKAGNLVLQSGQTIQTDISQVNAVKWKGKVALIDVTEYVRASTYSNCTNVYNGSYYNSSYPCKNSNWMYTSNISDWWTMSPISQEYSHAVWSVYDEGCLSGIPAYSSYGVRPVVTLSPEVKITSGDGTENNPFTLSLN